MDDQNLDIQAQSAAEVASAATGSEIDAMSVGERLSKRNLIMYPLGTFGRDFLYNFFNGYLLSFVSFTKTLTPAQYVMITVIIVLARIFDAFNDPIMGSIVENTRTKWGKYKPWQLIGAILTGGVIIALFNVPLDGWAFIGFLAFAYFMFSITFTMNDISYWGMMPSLTSNPDDRNKLTSFTQLVVSAGGGLAGLLVPMFTVGTISQALFGGAVRGYGIMSIAVSVLMMSFQLFTILGVKEKPLPANIQKTSRMKFKDLFKVLFKNDQLLWCTLVMLLWSVLSGIAIGNLLSFYIYFEFGYEGNLGTVFSILYAVLSVTFTLFYPWFSKKLGRNKTLYGCGISLIVSYALLLIVGLAWPNNVGGGFDLIGMHITPKFLVMAVCYGITGWASGFYMIMLINMTNTVEYNEWRTGKRDEAIIFSLRPFTAKMGSALSQGIVSLVLLATGAFACTQGIAALERKANAATAAGQKYDLVGKVGELIQGISPQTKMGLLACMCIIPMVLMTIALLIYKSKCKLDETTLAKMIEETEARKAAQTENADSEEILEEAASDADDSVIATVAESNADETSDETLEEEDEYSEELQEEYDSSLTETAEETETPKESDEPAQPETPASEQPAEVPAEDVTADVEEDQPLVEEEPTPEEEKPTAEKPASKKASSEQKPAEDKPSAKKPAAKKGSIKKENQKPSEEEKVLQEADETLPQHGKFVIKKTDKGNFTYKLFSSNKRVLAVPGGAPYKDQSSCKVGIQSVIKNAATAPIEDQTLKNPVPQKLPKWEIYEDSQGEFRLRLRASNNNIVATTNDGYTSKDAAKKGIAAIARAAQGASIVRNDDLW